MPNANAMERAATTWEHHAPVVLMLNVKMMVQVIGKLQLQVLGLWEVEMMEKTTHQEASVINVMTAQCQIANVKMELMKERSMKKNIR